MQYPCELSTSSKISLYAANVNYKQVAVNMYNHRSITQAIARNNHFLHAKLKCSNFVLKMTIVQIGTYPIFHGCYSALCRVRVVSPNCNVFVCD